MVDKLNEIFENLTSDDDLIARHKKQRKELQAKIQALKKTAGKGDKKKKKEVQEEIVRLESDLDKQQAEELANAEKSKETNNKPEDNNENNEEDANEGDDQQPTRISKAQKRRDKKATEEKQRQAEYLAQEELNKTGPRALETNAIKKILSQRKLQLHPIKSDGNCLYNAIRNQLCETGRKALDVDTLRNLTADYILEHKDAYIFYMTNADTGDCMDDDEFRKYCSTLRSTPAWGGQIEISALSKILEAPIEVIQASGPPTIQGEDEFSAPNLVITYHRHMYSLGEHYNGTESLREKADSDEN